MSDTVNEVKTKLGIEDVVSPYVKLTKTGTYFKGLCPFHKEKTPSFVVSPDRGFYHCFGCGKGGDIFTFIEEMEGVDFKGALKILAEKAGVPLVYEKGAGGSTDRIYETLAKANDYYMDQLTTHPDVRAYLAVRALTPATVGTWSVGYAPQGWRVTSDALRALGFTDGDLERAGLVKRSDKDEGKDTPRLYDRFRGRIMFPIKDTSGRVIAFSGRVYPAEEGANAPAKYLNSPETEVFHKSKVLYGLDVARAAIRTYDFAILVEGQVDLLMAHQAGYATTVATSGTAFTPEHAALLTRYTKNLVIAYDGDTAGIAAAGRAAAVALATGLNVKVAACPAGEDPADLIKRDLELWKRTIKQAVHVVDFYLAHLASLGYDERKFKLEVSRIVLPYVAMIGNAIDRAHFVTRVAEALGVAEDAVRTELAKIAQGGAGDSVSVVPGAPTYLTREEGAARLLAGIIAALGADPAAKALNERLAALVGSERVVALQREVAEDRGLIIEGDVFLDEHVADRAEALDEVVAIIKKGVLRSTYRAALMALKAAEAAGDRARVEEGMRTVAALAREL